jgi:REP element-mobilizing transposase RayT
MARGNAKSLIFLDGEDYRRFLEILAEIAARFSIAVYAYCLMPNHYHLVCRTREANVSAAVAYLNGVYAQWWNHRHSRCGHLTQGRFKAQLIQNDLYLRVVCRYVLDNPVRAALVRHPQDWEWSSARAAAGGMQAPPFLDTSLGGLREPNSSTLPQESRHVGSPESPPVYRGVARAVREDDRFLGDGPDLGAFRGLVRLARSAGIPRRDWVGIRPTLAEVFSCAVSAEVRDRQIFAARDDWGFTRNEIAAFLGIHPETVTRVVRRERSRSAEPRRGV